MDYAKGSLKLHKKLHGKFSIKSKIPIKTRDDLSLAYTPGVGAVSSYLAKHKEKVSVYTIKGNNVAVVSDGSAVLGLGNIGPEGALPVMEGKAILFKEFGGIDAYPIVLSTQDPEEIIAAVKAIAPTFGGINLEDISAPKCFMIEERLRAELNIPVVHDDQWGTAVVVLAGLINALKLTNRQFSSAKIVVTGAGAAGTAIIKILNASGAKHILSVDRTGIIYSGRPGNTPEKEALSALTNPEHLQGDLADALVGADVFIGVSQAGIVTESMVRSMNHHPIIFALANPIPEIMPDLAKHAGAAIIASGRSDFPNQVNNALVFPGLFRGLLDKKITHVTTEMLIQASSALAKLVTHPTVDKIIPSIFDKDVAKAIAASIN